MVVRTRQFRCFASGCGKFTPFDLTAAVKARTPGIECMHCHKEWVGSVLEQTCCIIKFNFSSVEKSANKSSKKVQSFSLK